MDSGGGDHRVVRVDVVDACRPRDAFLSFACGCDETAFFPSREPTNEPASEGFDRMDSGLRFGPAGDAHVAPDGTNVTTWRVAHVAGGCYRVFDGREALTLLEMMPWTLRGGFQLGDAYYRIEKRILSRLLSLETWGQPVARADVGLLRRGARIAFEDRELSLRPGYALAPTLGTLLVEESGWRIGRMRPRRAVLGPARSVDGVVELPWDVPLAVGLFTVYVALVLWKTWSYDST